MPEQIYACMCVLMKICAKVYLMGTGHDINTRAVTHIHCVYV